MTLVASGAISIGGTATNASINLELGRAQNATSNMGESALRTLAAVPSGAISMSNFYGKSNATVYANMFASPTTDTGPLASVTLEIRSDGYCRQIGVNDGTVTLGDWVVPTSAAGANYEVRVTRNSGTMSSGDATNSWLLLSTTRSWTVERLSVGTKTCNITVEFRMAASPFTVLATSSTFDMSAIYP